MIGEQLKHYRVEAVLGQGGMGIVYRARDVRLDRPVALKVLAAGLTTDPERKRRFLQEARSASAVTHPAIAQVYDVDEAEGTTFIAMEYVEGRTVRQLILDRELDLQGALAIALQVADGLARAHEAGIVHRDIKSDNIMVTRDGHAKILDFGLAKLLDPWGGRRDDADVDPAELETVAKTQAGVVLGTIAYMSPEQARGKPVDPRSDLFSLGVVIYEMVTGELPFKGDSPLETMHAIAYDEVRPVTVIRRNLPPEVHRIVSRCLRKRPEDRYADARALARDVKQLQRDIDSGIRRSAPIGERLREAREWLAASTPIGPAGLAAAVLAVLLVALLLFTEIRFGGLVLTGLIGLGIFRFVRNRRARMLKRFVQKAAKMPEVRAIFVRGEQITVIADSAQARHYIRINSLLETLNRKLFYGPPLEAALRDDVSPEELRELLREPGVVHVREDVLGVNGGKASGGRGAETRNGDAPRD